jgi:hypothetical protein
MSFLVIAGSCLFLILAGWIIHEMLGRPVAPDGVFKEVLRMLLFYPSMIFGNGEFVAKSGTLKFRFLEWLYGPGEPEFDVIWPDDDKEDGNP